MEKIFFQRKPIIALSMLILFSLAWMGCSTTVRERQPGQP
jgi:hypothetical protein